MKIVSLLLCLAMTFVARAADSAPSDATVASDEQALASATKALADVSSSVREAAAKKIREIIAKYPSKTPNIRETDGGESRWRRRLEQITPGMKEKEVVDILQPLFPGGGGAGGGGKIFTYQIDATWQCLIAFVYEDPTRGTYKVSRVVELKQGQYIIPAIPPKNYSGIWTEWTNWGEKSSDSVFKSGVIVPSTPASTGK